VTKRTGAAYWLWEEEQQIERSIESFSTEIERLEEQIVRTRTRRDDLRLRALEMRTARSILEQADIKVERVGTEVHVSIDPTFAARTSGEPT
jgi:phage shock protein A